MLITRSAMVIVIAAVAGIAGLSLLAAPALSCATGTSSSPKNSQGQHPSEQGSISGTVLDSAGKPVAGAKVLLFHHAQHAAGTTKKTSTTTQPAAHPHRQTVTDASGHFTFDKVHAGKHLLVAHKEGSGHGHVSDELKAGATDNVSITLHTQSK